ncbi:hypothetical protein FGO68_gene12197 [Halteria grandinella]|uniref:E2F/DP family winged-helix DNA-binding domain-containing protein n=1 Tax=Halteria grandinella TaxID=5974 RepID=A0A8J8T9D2_HALGN|nr:hypothetical protein FGO68_gene12197 [Halteria grandinella]
MIRTSKTSTLGIQRQASESQPPLSLKGQSHQRQDALQSAKEEYSIKRSEGDFEFYAKHQPVLRTSTSHLVGDIETSALLSSLISIDSTPLTSKAQEADPSSGFVKKPLITKTTTIPRNCEKFDQETKSCAIVVTESKSPLAISTSKSLDKQMEEVKVGDYSRTGDLEMDPMPHSNSSNLGSHEEIEYDQYSAQGIPGCAAAQLQYSRKEKSLGELCRRFLGIYGSKFRALLYLDQCTRELAVERRRIYDIINILESFQVINRQAKNAYQWKGIHKIVKSIERHIDYFQGHSIPGETRMVKLNDSGKQMQFQTLQIIKSSRVGSGISDDSIQNFENQHLETQISEFKAFNDGKPITPQIDLPISLGKPPKAAGKKEKKQSQNLLIWQLDDEDDKQSKYKKDKSLGILCQQFIGLFVTWRHVISLEEAARQISLREDGLIRMDELLDIQIDQELDNEEAQKLKTKIRRLYDIANVLQSIGLIEKTNQTYNKKPAFRWIGIHGVHSFVKELEDERSLNGLEQQQSMVGLRLKAVSDVSSSDGAPGRQSPCINVDSIEVPVIGLKRTYSETQPGKQAGGGAGQQRRATLSEKSSALNAIESGKKSIDEDKENNFRSQNQALEQTKRDHKQLEKDLKNLTLERLNSGGGPSSSFAPPYSMKYPITSLLYGPPQPVGVHRPIPQRKDSIDILYSALEILMQNRAAQQQMQRRI